MSYYQLDVPWTGGGSAYFTVISFFFFNKIKNSNMWETQMGTGNFPPIFKSTLHLPAFNSLPDFNGWFWNKSSQLERGRGERERESTRKGNRNTMFRHSGLFQTLYSGFKKTKNNKTNKKMNISYCGIVEAVQFKERRFHVAAITLLWNREYICKKATYVFTGRVYIKINMLVVVKPL